VGLAPPAQLVRPAPKALKASKDPSVLRAQSESRGRLALRDRQDQSARRARREKRVVKAQSALPASADHQGRKAPLAHPAPPDQLARRVTPARHRQFASSLVRIAFAAKATKSWLVFFARTVRPTERSARPPARRQLVYAYVGDLADPTSGTFSKARCAEEIASKLASRIKAHALRHHIEHRSIRRIRSAGIKPD
jgi:hypothetical protein